MAVSLRCRVASLVSVFLIVGACASGDRPMAPEFAISDGVHDGGTPGFYFLPPMVAQPTFSGSFDADITTLNPQVAICDITNGPDNNCGGAGGTSAVIVFTTMAVPGNIGAEAALSFLGVGVPPPTPAWGRTIGTAVAWIATDPWYLLVPASALFVVTFAFNLVGDGLRDAVDPRLVGKR